MDLRKTKINVAGKAIELQEKLFKMGYQWVGNDKNILKDSNILYIFIDAEGCFSWGKNMEAFIKRDYKKVPVQDILDYEIPPKDWKDDLEAGEYLINDLLNKNPLVDCTPAYKGIEFFKDKDKAIHTIKILKLHLEMLRFAELRNGDWKANWNYGSQLKYGLELDAGIITVNAYRNWNFFINQISFRSKDIAEEALKIFGYRILELYNLKS
ncbi:MAG: hypothetical protein ACTTJM_00050 [Bergeyella cardium]